MAPLLQTKGLSKNFGSLCAVDKVSYTIDKNQTFGIIGSNGSGKTTFFNLLSGYYFPTEGEIFYKGQKINKLSPAERSNIGIVRTFQLVSVFETLSVWENLVLSTYSASDAEKKKSISFFFTDRRNEEIMENCLQALKTVGIEDKADKPVKELSYGDKRLLEIAIVLSMKPELMLLDEPFAGLSDYEIDFISDLIQSLKGTITQVIIEHKISKIQGFVEKLSVFHEGKLICEGDSNFVLNNEEVRKCYWGNCDEKNS
jgi:branched-chain amino acid transport system ATP-binding protein